MKFLKVFALFVSCSGVAAAACPPAAGCNCTPATRYDVRLLEAALCRDSACTTSYVVGSSAKTFDIASAAVGSAIGSYAQLDALPVGVYTYIKVVLDRAFGITGNPVGGCAAQTAANPLYVPNGVPFDGLAGIPGMSWNDAAKTQIKIIEALPTPLVISKAGARPSITIKFDTQNGLMCLAGPLPLPATPSTTITVNN